MLQISCIIPCYNAEKYISEAIDSVLSQTIVPKEILLIYDHSVDETLNIIKQKEKKYEDKIKIIISKEKKGLSFARNLGIENMTGDYILFLDADDVIEPRLLEKYINRLEELNSNNKEKYELCYSACTQIDENSEAISDVVRGFQFEPEETLGYEFIRNHIMSPSGVLLSKEYFYKAGKFNESLSFTEDWDLWLRLAPITGFAYVDEPLVKIRRHKDNMSAMVSTQLNAEINILKQYDLNYIKDAIFKRNLNIEENTVDYVSLLFRLDNWEDGFLELKELLDKGYNFYNLYFYSGLYYLKTNNYKIALEYFLKTIDVRNDHGAALNNVGALFLLEGDKNEAKEYLDLAIGYFPSYMDANNNFKLLGKETVYLEELKFTWRELRKVLTNYRG